MNRISSLDGVFKIFEIIKFQHFSLKSVLVNPSAQQRCSFASIAHSVLVWVFLTACITFLSVTSFIYGSDGQSTASTFYGNDSLEQNKLNFVMKFIVMGNAFGAIYASLVVSIVKKHHFVKFFKYSDQISRICELEFRYRVRYENLKRELHVALVAVLSAFLFGIIIVLASAIIGSQLLCITVLIILTMIPSFFLCLFTLKFYFYAQVVNFQLRLFMQLLENSFSGNLNKSKVLQLRKIFTIIRDMVQQINKSTNIVLVFILFLDLISFTRYSFILLMIFGGKRDDHIGRKT
jgi:hypothetical protein